MKDVQVTVVSASARAAHWPNRARGRWFCYLIECADGTFYTGITTSVDRRLTMHNRGRASKYTRGRLPVTLVYVERHLNRASASRRELQVKGMSRAQKRALGALTGVSALRS